MINARRFVLLIIVLVLLAGISRLAGVVPAIFAKMTWMALILAFGSLSMVAITCRPFLLRRRGQQSPNQLRLGCY